MTTKSYELARDAVYLRTNKGLTSFNEGDKVELGEDAAESLLKRGWVKETKAKIAKKVETKKAE